MRVISILNFKGGTGKSSLAENLSHALALQGSRVLVIDADRQGNASATLLKQAHHRTAQFRQTGAGLRGRRSELGKGRRVFRKHGLDIADARFQFGRLERDGITGFAVHRQQIMAETRGRGKVDRPERGRDLTTGVPLSRPKTP